MTATSLPTPRGEVTIRACRPEDWPAYRELRLQALRDHPTAFSASYEDNLLHRQEFWQKRLTTDDEREALFLAESRGALIGMTGIYRDLGKKTRHQGDIWGVYVKPEWRGVHLAEALIEACLGWARGKGIVIARLGVATDNLAAIRCYERCGFITDGTIPKAILHEGHYVDETLMSCSLENDESER